jgi:hypothetical protein
VWDARFRIHNIFQAHQVCGAGYITAVFICESVTNALKVGEDVLVPVKQTPLEAEECKPQLALLYAVL